MSLRILVACEYSGVVREAFRAKGHYAVSCDILPSEDGSIHHYQGDVRDILSDPWDLMVAHPPCTYLCNSGVRWLYKPDPLASNRKVKAMDRWRDMRDGAAFFKLLQDAPIPFIAIENPVMHRHARELVYDWPTCSVQPWQFGHLEKKRTMFWLKNLPPLVPTTDLLAETEALPMKEQQKVFYASPKADRWKDRSRTYKGIAEAMADQWGQYVCSNL